MKTLILKLSLIFVTLSFTLQAQPAQNALERIQTLKKMKLIEILNLNEADAEKVLLKYNSAERMIREKNEIIDNIDDELALLLKKNASESDIKALSQKLVAAQNDIFNAQNEKLKMMQSVLNTKDYAKYLLFEKNFNKKIRKMLIDAPKKMRDRLDMDDEFDEPPPPPRKR